MDYLLVVLKQKLSHCQTTLFTSTSPSEYCFYTLDTGLSVVCATLQ